MLCQIEGFHSCENELLCTWRVAQCEGNRILEEAAYLCFMVICVYIYIYIYIYIIGHVEGRQI